MIINNRQSESDDIIYAQLPGEVSYYPSVLTKTKTIDANNITYIEWNPVNEIPNNLIKIKYYHTLTDSSKKISDNTITIFRNAEEVASLTNTVSTRYEQTEPLNLFDVINTENNWVTDSGNSIELNNSPKFTRGTISNVLSELQDNAESLNTLDYNSISSLNLSYKGNYFVYSINNDGYLYLTPKIESNIITDVKNINCVVLGFNDLAGIYNYYYNEYIYDNKPDISSFNGQLRSPILTVSNNPQYDSPTNIYIDGKTNPIHILGYIENQNDIHNINLEFIPIDDNDSNTGISLTVINDELLNIELFPAYNAKFNSEYTGLSLTVENFFNRQFVNKIEIENITNIYNSVLAERQLNTYTLKTVYRSQNKDTKFLNYIYTANELMPILPLSTGLISLTNINKPKVYSLSTDNIINSEYDYKIFDKLTLQISYKNTDNISNINATGKLIYEYNMIDGLVPEYDKFGNLVSYSPVYIDNDNNVQIASNTIFEVSALTINEISEIVLDEQGKTCSGYYIRLSDDTIGKITTFAPNYNMLDEIESYEITYTKYQYFDPNSTLPTSDDINDRTLIMLSGNYQIADKDNIYLVNQTFTEPPSNMSDYTYQLNLASAKGKFYLNAELPLKIDEKYSLSTTNIVWSIRTETNDILFTLSDNISSDYSNSNFNTFIKSLVKHFYSIIEQIYSNKIIIDNNKKVNTLLFKYPGYVKTIGEILNIDVNSEDKFEIYFCEEDKQVHPIKNANQVPPMSLNCIKLNENKILYVFGYRYTFVSISEDIPIPSQYLSINKNNNDLDWVTPNHFNDIINFNGDLNNGLSWTTYCFKSGKSLIDVDFSYFNENTDLSIWINDENNIDFDTIKTKLADNIFVYNTILEKTDETYKSYNNLNIMLLNDNEYTFSMSFNKNDYKLNIPKNLNIHRGLSNIFSENNFENLYADNELDRIVLSDNLININTSVPCEIITPTDVVNTIDFKTEYSDTLISSELIEFDIAKYGERI